MYKCNCRADGKSIKDTFTKFHYTETDEEGICNRCGYYALWYTGKNFLTTNRTKTYTRGISVFNESDKSLVGVYENHKEAARSLGKSKSWIGNYLTGAGIKDGYILIRGKFSEYPKKL